MSFQKVELDPKTELPRIKQRILMLVDGVEGTRPYILSRLGLDLGKDLMALRLLTGMSLSQFLQAELRDQIRLDRVVGHPNVSAVSRNKGYPPVDLGAKIEAPAESKVELPEKEERYHYRFWAAFSVRLPDGMLRYFDRKSFFFKNIMPTEAPPIGWLPIEAEFVAPEKAYDRDDVIKANINRWFAKHQLQKSDFFEAALKPSSHRQTGVERSLLVALLESLDKRQLQTTTLALDIVAELLNRRAE